jgi:hypothetical protein
MLRMSDTDGYLGIDEFAFVCPEPPLTCRDEALLPPLGMIAVVHHHHPATIRK